MKPLFNIWLSVILLLLHSLAGFSEGTKQVAPFDTAQGKLCIDKSRNDFGSFNAGPEFRINIYIADPSEKICFGLGKILQVDSTVVVQYQLRDPAGNIVLGPFQLPKSGPGFISTYDQDTIGPFPADNGYNPIEYPSPIRGNYSLEFYYPPDLAGTYSMSRYVRFEFFDITVLDASGKPKTGRLWSKAWQFNCGVVEPPPTDSRFFGTVYILSDDSIVTSVNCNGFVGGTFSISSNETGCSTTGNIATDRQSHPGFHTYPQYKVFLTDPDSIIFPTGRAKPGINLPIMVTNDCATGSVDLGVRVSHDGLIELLVEVVPGPGADPRDVKLTANVLANPGGNGYNIIHWNGNDGLGNPVTNGVTVRSTVRFIRGITHLPIYDIEYNDNGYIVEVVRPPGPKPEIYWDDRLLPGVISANLNGCTDLTGCHLWDIETGDTNTINSWWYVSRSITQSLTFQVKRIPGQPGKISGNNVFCEGGVAMTYTIMRDPGTSSYTWSYSGTGATVISSDTSALVTFDATATSGTLAVYGTNPCGDGQESALQIFFYPPPQVSLAAFDTICYNEPALILTGGNPAGGEYRINGTAAASIDPLISGTGNHLISYSYTDSHGCDNSDSTTIFIKTGTECEIVIWMPNAFTPDGDGLNDVFRPVSNNIRQYILNIYNRSGQLVFTSTQPEVGWDGTLKGELCPEGSYVFVVVYQSSLSPPENSTLTGNVVLIR